MIGFVTMDETGGRTTAPDEDALRLQALEEYFPNRLLELLSELDLLTPPAAAEDRWISEDCRLGRSKAAMEDSALLVATSKLDSRVSGKVVGFDKSPRELRRSAAQPECQDSAIGSDEDVTPGTHTLKSHDTCFSEKTLCTKSLARAVHCGFEGQERGTEIDLKAQGDKIVSPRHNEMPPSQVMTPVEHIVQPKAGDPNNDYQTNLVQNEECLLTSRCLHITEMPDLFSRTSILGAQDCGCLKAEPEKKNIVSETKFSEGADGLDKKPQGRQRDKQMSCSPGVWGSSKFPGGRQTLQVDDVIGIETTWHKEDVMHTTSAKPPTSAPDALSAGNLMDRGCLDSTGKQKCTHAVAGNTSAVTDTFHPARNLNSATDPHENKSEEIRSDKSQEKTRSAEADDQSNDNPSQPVLADVIKTGVQHESAAGSLETLGAAVGHEPPKRKRGRPRKQPTVVASRLIFLSSETSSQNRCDDKSPRDDIANLFSREQGLTLSNACRADQREGQKEQKTGPCQKRKGKKDVKIANCASGKECPPNKMQKIRPVDSDIVEAEAVSLFGSDCASVKSHKQDSERLEARGSKVELSPKKKSANCLTDHGSRDAGQPSAGLEMHRKVKSASEKTTKKSAPGRVVKQTCSSSASEDGSSEVRSLGHTSLQAGQNMSEDSAVLPGATNSASTSSQHVEFVDNCPVNQTSSSQSQQAGFTTDLSVKATLPPPAQQAGHSASDHQPEDKKLLPDGWHQEVVQRTGGKFPGRRDVYIYSPCGTKFRSLKEISKYASEKKLLFDIKMFKKKLQDRTSPVPSLHGEDREGNTTGGDGEEGSQQGQVLLNPRADNPPKRPRGRPRKVSSVSSLASQARAHPDVSRDVR